MFQHKRRCDYCQQAAVARFTYHAYLQGRRIACQTAGCAAHRETARKVATEREAKSSKV